MDEFDEIAAGLPDVQGPAAIGSLADHLRAVCEIVEVLRSTVVTLADIVGADTSALVAITDGAAGQATASLGLVADTIERLAQAAAGEEGL